MFRCVNSKTLFRRQNKEKRIKVKRDDNSEDAAIFSEGAIKLRMCAAVQEGKKHERIQRCRKFVSC